MWQLDTRYRQVDVAIDLFKLIYGYDFDRIQVVQIKSPGGVLDCKYRTGMCHADLPILTFSIPRNDAILRRFTIPFFRKKHPILPKLGDF